jgi:two-component system chemotaxis sensor kinase CheA
MDDKVEYKEMYAVESAEHLQTMNDALLCLEKDMQNSETINILFRAAHTLKGMSATMGYTNIAELTHKMENLMDKIRKNEMILESDTIDILFESCDMLEKMVEEPEDSTQCDISNLIQKLLLKTNRELQAEAIGRQSEDVKDQNVPDKNNNLKIPDKGNRVFEVTITLHESCTLKSARSAIVIRNLSEVGEILEMSPPARDIEDEKFDREFAVTISTELDPEDVENAITKISEISKVEVIPKEGLPAVSIIKDKKGEKERNRADVKSVQSVRVGIERLDSLMNLVGELAIIKIRLMQLTSENNYFVFDETLASLDRLTNDLQKEVIASRMVPLEHIFNRFPRMVRDLAKKESKEVDLIVTGNDIELDRTVLDEVGDPLVHILRNCIDHGIESPEIRKQQGKNSKGTIKLTARREKSNVAIDIEDDGKGMDPEKFREVIVKKSIMTKDEVSRLSDMEVLNFSYLPGFSTAEKVTEVSGRGVGMDVVRTKIESMGGTVRIESRVYKGTKIMLRLPLTVAIIQSQLVKVGKDIYAIPITNVIKDVIIKKDRIKTIQSKEVIIVGSEILPIIRLNKLFGVDSNAPDQLNIVVVEKNGTNVGLVVDRLIGKQEIIIKNLDNPFLKDLKGFAGATIMGNGNVALILDVGTLL